jgi:uncharacterized protein YprB with RNaseH-like and TPR domain
MTIVKYKESQINPNRWSDEMIKNRVEFKCKEHRHNGVNHAACYNKEKGIEERKGCLDIEAGALNADFDICLSWSIKKSGKDEVVFDHLIKTDLTIGRYDSRLIATLIDEMWNYDRLITHYGSNFRFDIPFIRARYLWLVARGLYEGKPFPQQGEMWLSDTYTFAKKLLKIASRRQDAVANAILGKDIKTRIDKDHWMAIKYGSPEKRSAAIEYIVDHNIKDVYQLDENYCTLLPYMRETRTSI